MHYGVYGIRYTVKKVKAPLKLLPVYEFTMSCPSKGVLNGSKKAKAAKILRLRRQQVHLRLGEATNITLILARGRVDGIVCKGTCSIDVHYQNRVQKSPKGWFKSSSKRKSASKQLLECQAGRKRKPFWIESLFAT